MEEETPQFQRAARDASTVVLSSRPVALRRPGVKKWETFLLFDLYFDKPSVCVCVGGGGGGVEIIMSWNFIFESEMKCTFCEAAILKWSVHFVKLPF